MLGPAGAVWHSRCVLIDLQATDEHAVICWLALERPSQPLARPAALLFGAHVANVEEHKVLGR